MITKIAPKMVIYLPENSLPNNNPSPIPPIIPMGNPVFSMFLLPPNYSLNIFSFLIKPVVLKATGEKHTREATGGPKR